MRWVMDEPGYGRAPVMCTDHKGRCWVAWIAWHEGEGESVRATWRSSGGEWQAPFVCTPTRSYLSGVSICPWKDGVLIAWIDGDDREEDGLKLRYVHCDSSASDPLLVAPGRRNPAHPSVAAGNARFDLCWTVRVPGGRALHGAFGTDLGSLSEPATYSEGPGLNVWPVIGRCDGDIWVVWQAMQRRASRVLARKITDPASSIVELTSHREGIFALPAVCSARGGGLWIAWQSDLDPHGGAGLVRWIDLVHLSSGGTVRYPKEAMPDVDCHASGEDQGFESPALVKTPDGRVVIFGRGSQSLRRQDLGAGGWSPRFRLDDEGWECRGSQYRAAVTSDGICIVGRERDGISVRLLPYGESDYGGSPVLGREEELEPLARLSDLPERPPKVIAGRQILFGDIHQHTRLSDGTGTAEETFHRARHRYGDDMAAIADHESFLGKRTPPGAWNEVCRVVDEAYEPGDFVTLPAFEWTGAMHPGPGHKVVYLPPRGGPLLSRDSENSKSSKQLIHSCRELGALVFPHHVGWTGADMEHHDPEVQCCWEIISCHGAYERPGAGPIGTRGDDKEGQFVGDALDAGLRFGVVGGSDGHGLNWHHGVSRIKDSHRTGLTAVFSDEATREGVLNALSRRCCYATSGAKIGLWFEVEGRPMGEEILSADPVVFRIIVEAPTEVRSIILVTNGGEETPLEAAGHTVDIKGTLPPAPLGGWCYYYVRVVLDDNEVAWSSPIWLDYPSSA